MIIKNLKKGEDGSYDFDFTVSEDEAEFLMDYAIQNLIIEGLISVAGGKSDMELEFIERDEEDTLQ
jgi:hypothetical protein